MSFYHILHMVFTCCPIKHFSQCNITAVIKFRNARKKKRFVNEGKNEQTGQKIATAMKRVSIPGYSQHHTGLAIDYGGNTICLRKNAWPNGDFNKLTN